MAGNGPPADGCSLAAPSGAPLRTASLTTNALAKRSQCSLVIRRRLGRGPFRVGRRRQADVVRDGRSRQGGEKGDNGDRGDRAEPAREGHRDREARDECRRGDPPPIPGPDEHDGDDAGRDADGGGRNQPRAKNDDQEDDELAGSPWPE